MKALRRVLALAALSALCAGATASAAAELNALEHGAQVARSRWHKELEAFRLAPPSPATESTRSLLFLGSSSVRLWPRLAQDFQGHGGVINRGFGGSTLEDCALLAPELLAREVPAQVVVYAGDNDLAQGRSPLQVLDSFARLASAIRELHPAARIVFVAIKPSPARATLIGNVRETNDAIAAYLRRLPNSAFADVFTPMLDATGQPRPELFLPDRLHMNETGYALWRAEILPHLDPAPRPAP